MGFSHCQVLDIPQHAAKGFRRPITMFVKGDPSPAHSALSMDSSTVLRPTVYAQTSCDGASPMGGTPDRHGLFPGPNLPCTSTGLSRFTPDNQASPIPAGPSPKYQYTSIGPSGFTPEYPSASPVPSGVASGPYCASPMSGSYTPDPQCASPAQSCLTPDYPGASPLTAGLTPDPQSASPAQSSLTPDYPGASPLTAGLTPDPQSVSPGSLTPDPHSTSPFPSGLTTDFQSTSPIGGFPPDMPSATGDTSDGEGVRDESVGTGFRETVNAEILSETLQANEQKTEEPKSHECSEAIPSSVGTNEKKTNTSERDLDTTKTSDDQVNVTL